MPHVILEYSSNLEPVLDFPALAKVVHATLLETGLFELGAVRVRAFRAEAYAIGDLQPRNAFIDMSLRLGAGRSVEDRKSTGDKIFAAVSEHVGGLVDPLHFALSLEVREIDPELTWKENGMHLRLRKPNGDA